jgi:hypothetical protein
MGRNHEHENNRIKPEFSPDKPSPRKRITGHKTKEYIADGNGQADENRVNEIL